MYIYCSNNCQNQGPVAAKFLGINVTPGPRTQSTSAPAAAGPRTGKRGMNTPGGERETPGLRRLPKAAPALLRMHLSLRPSGSPKIKQPIPCAVKFSIILLTRIFYCYNYKAIKCKKKEKEERKEKPFPFQER